MELCLATSSDSYGHSEVKRFVVTMMTTDENTVLQWNRLIMHNISMAISGAI